MKHALRHAAAFLLATGAFAGTTAHAKDVDLQQAMVEQCVGEMQHFKVADAATAKKLCACTTQVQADNLKLGEFWQMQSYALSGKSPHTLPAVKRIQPKLQACRKGLTLNKPQVPQKTK